MGRGGRRSAGQEEEREEGGTYRSGRNPMATKTKRGQVALVMKRQRGAEGRPTERGETGKTRKTNLRRSRRPLPAHPLPHFPRQPLTRGPTAIRQPLQFNPLPPLLTPINLVQNRAHHIWHSTRGRNPFAAEERGDGRRVELVEEDEGHPHCCGEEEEGLVGEDVEEGDDLRDIGEGGK